MRPTGILVASLLVVAVFQLLPLAAIPQNINRKTYLGFDANDYPGDDALPILRKTFSFAGYWLSPPPEEKNSSWLGKRALMERQGFGFAVLWNGRLSAGLKSIGDAQRKGEADAHAAARAARQEGFPQGTVIFLDIEEGGRLSAEYHAYLDTWIDVLEQEKFRPGAYCSAMPVSEGNGVVITSAQNIQDRLGGRTLLFWVFNDACPPSPGCSFAQSPESPEKGGFRGAAIWQYAQSPRRKQFTQYCAATYARDGNCYAPNDSAHKWFLDLNVADSPNPSAPK